MLIYYVIIPSNAFFNTSRPRSSKTFCWEAYGDKLLSASSTPEGSSTKPSWDLEENVEYFKSSSPTYQYEWSNENC